MENDETKDIVADEDVLDELPSEDDADVDWKALALKNQGIAKRYETKLQKKQEAEELAAKEAEKAKTEEKQPQDKTEKTEFDLAEKSYLLANGIKKEQIPLFWEEQQKTKMSIDELMASPYFQEKLESAKSADATPSGTKRGGASARNEVDYWVEKVRRGEGYPPNTSENFKLRGEVAERLAETDKNTNKFTTRPIAGA